jgi:L-alanine-DL-glutamate epimerase-like enolase superfamily enzyme
MSTVTRRDLLRSSIAAPASLFLINFRAFAEAHLKKVKITEITAMQIKNIAGNSLVRIKTDGGLTGYGESGANGPMTRARIDTMKPLLIGQDPLEIGVHFENMSTLMHPYVAHIPTISGIDIALWDLAGKILGVPVSTLLGGRFRDNILMYAHEGPLKNALDPASCREWAQAIRQLPEGFNAFKIGIHPYIGVPAAKFADTLDSAQLRDVHRAYNNLREAAGDEIDIAVHCHNELDTPSAIGVAKAVETMNPLFIEDILNPPFSEAWMAVRRATRVPLLTGEKLELVRQFKPFLDNQAVDYVHPDLAFAGGFTGTKRIADYAALTRTPVALHNVGSLVLTYASAHFAASIKNFYRSESALDRPDHYVELMAASDPPVVRNSRLPVPTGPGLGVNLNEEFLRANLVENEPYWN